MHDPAQNCLEQTFGFKAFRPGQRALIDALMVGRNLLAVMPTGGGKSLCYQLPALLKPGLTLVVSPLIALMDNQVSALDALGVQAAAVHSGKDRGEKAATWTRMRDGSLKLLYLSPELLATERLQAALGRFDIAQVIVDEAHCISQWGHDFRPEYRVLGQLASRFPDAAVAGFTATADKATREDVARQLFGERGGEVFVHGFDRPNIRLSVQDKDRVDRQLLAFLAERPGQQGIVYRLSRRNTEATAALLQGEGLNAAAYHAGLEARVRKDLLDRFLTENDLVIVATIAFGMGIDKADIRFVVHMDLPGNLEAYYQEIGRAGRDGAPAEAVLFYGFDDIRRRRLMIDSKEVAGAVKGVETRRLEALLAFAETPGCRKQALLGYFGEATTPCGTCDRCLDPPDLQDGTGAAKAVLATIEATGGRFGQAHIVDILSGKATPKVAQFGHERLDTFGAFKDQDWQVVRSTLRQLFARGVIEVDIAGHGALTPGRLAEAVVAGDAEVQIDLRRRTATTTKAKPGAVAAPPPGGADGRLLAGLKALRLRIAREIAKPAYVVFSDASLIDMARRRPRDREAFLAVQGVGAAKCDLYAEAFLDAITAFEAEEAA